MPGSGGEALMTLRHTQPCPIAATVNVIGDHWSMLILREAFLGRTRFGEFERHTGIAKNLLSQRLGALVEHGVLQRQDVGHAGKRFAYVLSEKGEALLPVMMAMADWGNAQIYGAGHEPVMSVEKKSGVRVAPLWPVGADGRKLARRDMRMVAGPGFETGFEPGFEPGSEVGADQAVSKSAAVSPIK
ncbi:helix-turn-helix transcriptional regulator [Rhodobacteraceae bacterium D3-12]|nr:helix-turn-helix transcriptional regulator [Rhodobacteraceae bacterium D3-12]